jgi:hypothetical protein
MLLRSNSLASNRLKLLDCQQHEVLRQTFLTPNYGFPAYASMNTLIPQCLTISRNEELTRLERPLDETEFIEVRAFPFADAIQMVLQGEIMDGMTIIAILSTPLV